jgi:adenine-specific DNA-methyltransferase
MYNSRLKTSSRALRLKQTDAERVLWFQLRSRRFKKLKFRRQYVIGDFIVDFCSVESKLIVELDGGQHCNYQVKDEARTKRLEANGYRVIRFWNHEVLKNLEALLERIRQSV